MHRYIKSADLNYEDEKFSYLIVSKENLVSSENRIIRRPIKRPRHIHLTLCGINGLENIVISSKQKDVYKKARKAKWGEEL